MSWNYVVTAHKPTAVTTAVTGYFTHPKNDPAQPLPNLIIAKGNRLSVCLLSIVGLETYLEVPIFGNIIFMQTYPLPGCKKDVLCIFTSANWLSLIEYDGEKEEFITRASNVLEVLGGKPVDMGPFLRIDEEHNLLGAILFKGIFMVVPFSPLIQSTPNGSAEVPIWKYHDVKLNDLDVITFTFLNGCVAPTMCYLAETVDGRKFHSLELNLNDLNLSPGPIPTNERIDSEAHLLIPLSKQHGGVLVLGKTTITYLSPTQTFSQTLPGLCNAFSCYDVLGDDRMLLADDKGQLIIIILIFGDGMLTQLIVEQIGETCIPSCLAHLDQGVVFVGSRAPYTRHSQTGETSATISKGPMNYFEKLDTYVNIGPILDMCVVDLEKHGQGQLVTCSGMRHDGSLRVIRNGIGINKEATMDLSGITKVWTLALDNPLIDGIKELEHDTIVLTFILQTSLLKVKGMDVEEVEHLGGLVEDKQTLHCSNVIHGQIIQITCISVRLLQASTLELLDEWGTKDEIVEAQGNSLQILVATKVQLFYLEVEDGRLLMQASRTLEHEIICMDITPRYPHTKTDVCAVATWRTKSVLIINLPSLNEISSTELEAKVDLKSLMLWWNMDDVNYLLCGMDNGSMYYFVVDSSGNLIKKKKLILGSEPALLKQFYSQGSSNVFACSDKPTIIYSHNRKLTFSDVNLTKVISMAPLNSEFYSDCLVLADDSTLSIGKIDKIQKLHITPVPLGETPYKIAHQDATKTFGVLSTRHEIFDSVSGETKAKYTSASLEANLILKATTSERENIVELMKHWYDNNDDVEIHSLLILDQYTFEIYVSYELQTQESAVSIISCTLDKQPCYVVGTAYVYLDEIEPKNGRLLIFSFSNSKLELITETKINGAVYSIKFFNGMLLCAINSTVILYEITKESGIVEKCSHDQSVLSMMLKTKGDFILVGDLMKSITLLNYRDGKSPSLTVIAQDLDSKWMLAMEFIDDDSFLGCENFFNLFSLIKNPDVSTESEQSRLIQFGQYHLGEVVNVFTHGSLVMETAEARPPCIQGNPILYAGVYGSIGLVVPIAEDAYDLLIQVQNKLLSHVSIVGSIDHAHWRSFKTDNKNKQASNFIDGDLVEMLLDLPRLDMITLFKDIKLKSPQGDNICDSDEVFKLIEELARLH